MPETCLTIDRLGRRFGDRWIFRGLSAEGRAGDVLALTGPNGAGKTTLLKVLTTLLTPTEGGARVAGFDVRHEARRARARLAWVPASDGGGFARLTGRENLFLHGYLRGLGRKTIERRLDELGRVETLERALDVPFHLCSSGMRQCLSLARAWLGGPRVLFLDEPSRSLDAASRGELWRLVRSIASQGLVVFSTHWEGEWSEVATSRIVLGEA